MPIPFPLYFEVLFYVLIMPSQKDSKWVLYPPNLTFNFDCNPEYDQDSSQGPSQGNLRFEL